jgi:hypothetical protein
MSSRDATRGVFAKGIWAVFVSIGLVYGHDASSGNAGAQGGTPGVPLPVRNDVAKPGREILVLRNHQLRKGGHASFYQFSRDGLWPYFERIGARVVGQWRIIEPESRAAEQQDEVYRLVRYASFEHWQATRASDQFRLGGNGPAYENGQRGLQDRGDLEIGSRGAYFLEGRMAPGGPLFMPALSEQYELVQSGRAPLPGDREIPVRLDTARPGDEIVALKYERVQKNAFERFVESTQLSIWPFEEKLGARPIGQWKVVHPGAPDGKSLPGLRFMTVANSSYDEIVTMTRYASRAHMEALTFERAVFMGGNGPDWSAWRSALMAQAKVTLSTSVEIVQGFLYQSPPMFLPGLPEQYRRVN